MSAVGVRPGVRGRLLVVVLVGYLGVVAYGVFGPAPDDHIRRAGEGVRRVAGEIGVAEDENRRGEAQRQRRRRVENPLPGRLTNEAVANVAMFVPFGLLFPLVVPRWRWWTVPAGVVLSLAIELLQLLFLSWRSPSLADIAWNSLGALIGFSVWLTASALWHATNPRT